MALRIIPFVSAYTEQCADLLQHLWKETAEERLAHFEWAYLHNPNNEGVVAAVIAVNDENQVLGFRGFHLLKAYWGGVENKIAYIADTVVSPDARRQGILMKMTRYSFKFLKENGIFCIGDLGPSWPPYHGYKKLGFEDLSLFNRKFRFYALPLIQQKLRHAVRQQKPDYQATTASGIVTISTSVGQDILSQLPDSRQEGVIRPCRDKATLKWKSEHPGAKYVYAYTTDAERQLKSFLWFKTSDNYRYIVGLCHTTDEDNLKTLYKTFCKQVRPSIVEIWTWALDGPMKRNVKALRFRSVPFINKIKKNPPAIVRSLLEDDTGQTDWVMAGIDIRKARNWVVDKFEADSF